MYHVVQGDGHATDSDTGRESETRPQDPAIADERGLYLVVRTTGSRSWVQRITIDGDRTDIGLGGYPDVRLALARKKSAEIRTAVAEGRDPRAERRQPNIPTFRDAAEQYILENSDRWKNPKEAINWRGSLATYAYPKFGNTRIDRVTRADVLNALKPVSSPNHHLPAS
ncbi:Integrase [Geodia barretti]|uniref:Integrase n=1 Tax=Geodia barretti TaxID=519541 RepID=A0AA35W3B7_GEOBA|nr:Integrase [Geodia barretti]